MAKKGFSGELVLLLTALIWGSAFVAQSSGADSLGAFSFTALRNVLAVIVLFPVIALLDRLNGTKPTASEKRIIYKGGAICGVLLCIAANLQQFAIGYVDANGVAEPVGKVSFLTALYIVLVPAFGVFFGRKTDIKTWISVAIACAGMYLLTGMGGDFSIGGGDLLAIACAAVFALQIIAVDRFAPGVDCVRLSQVQFAVCGGLSVICALIFEDTRPSAVLDARWAILYCGVMSSGVAYTLQTVGQSAQSPRYPR